MKHLSSCHLYWLTLSPHHDAPATCILLIFTHSVKAGMAWPYHSKLPWIKHGFFHFWSLDHPKQTSCSEDAASNRPLITGLQDKGKRKGRVGDNTSFTTQSIRIHAAQRLISCVIIFISSTDSARVARPASPANYSPAGRGAEVAQMVPFHGNRSALYAH